RTNEYSPLPADVALPVATETPAASTTAYVTVVDESVGISSTSKTALSVPAELRGMRVSVVISADPHVALDCCGRGQVDADAAAHPVGHGNVLESVRREGERGQDCAGRRGAVVDDDRGARGRADRQAAVRAAAGNDLAGAGDVDRRGLGGHQRS